jgi:tetrahydromethanopterin S-methyltransferase subunit G
MFEELIAKFDGKFEDLMKRLDEIERKIDEIKEK